MSVHLLLTLLLVNCLEFGSKTSIDPDYLFWPHSSWNVNPVAMTSNHAGDIADITFTFTPSTTLASGIFYVGFPKGFPVASRFVTNLSFISGVDISVKVPSVQLPSASGVYGPISIKTRVSSNGNIIDINKIFTTIPISPPKPVAKANSLQVSFLQASTSIISSPCSLLFDFVLSVDLWKYDLLTLHVDSNFPLVSPTCTSGVPYLAGSDITSPSSISCWYDPTVSLLYIYGLSQDITVDLLSSTGAVPMNLQITGFTNPSISYPASDFTWNLVITRYATSTVVQQFVGNGPTVIPGTITVTSWTPHNGMAAAEIVSGQVLYMDLVVGLEHAVPKTGIITVVFSGIDIYNTVWSSDATQTTSAGSTQFLLVSPYLGGTCATSRVQITCSNFAADLSPGSILFSTLSAFSGSSAKLVSVTTSDSLGNLIDLQYNSIIIRFPISISEQVIPYFTLQFASDNAGTYTANTMSSALMYICFKVNVSVPPATTISLSLPLVRSLSKDLYITAGASVKANLLSSATLVTGYNFLIGSLIGLSDPVVSSNNITISLAALATSTTANNYIYIYLTSDAASTSPAFTLPMAATNTATMYESTISFKVGAIGYKASQALTILPSSLGATASLLCTSVSTPGIPLTVTFTPPLSYSLDIGSSLVVELEFDNNYPSDLGSGISGTYPAYTNINKVTFTLVVGTVARIQMQGLLGVSDLTTYTFAIPVGAMAATLNVNIKLYFLTSLRSDVEYQVMLTSVSTPGTPVAAAFGTVVSSTIPSTSVSAGSPLIYSTFSMQVAPYVTAGTYSSGYLGLILGQGFQIEQPTATLSSDTGLISPILYYFSSTNLNFNFPSIYFGLTASIPVSTSTLSISLNTFTAPPKSFTSLPSIVLAPAASGTCTAQGTGNPITISPSTLLTPSFTPSTIEALGPSSLVQTITVSFTISYSISGAIALALNSNWGITSNTLASALGIPGTYTISTAGNLYTIAGLTLIKPQTSITLTLTCISPPVTAGSYGHFDSIVTYMDPAQTTPVETWTDSLHISCTVLSAAATGQSKFSGVSVFPNAAGADYVYLNLQFSLTHSLPVAGTISIYSALNYYGSTGDQSENCWCSVQYSSCEIANEVLVITLAQAYVANTQINLILDVAFDLPMTTGLTDGGFAVITQYNGLVVDADSLVTFTNSQRLDIATISYGEFTMGQNPLILSTTTEGELAMYAFNFSVNVTIETSDSLLFSFPYEFDAYLGNPLKKFKWGDPNSYYANCSSFALSTVTCKLDHWNLIVTSFTKSIPSGEFIDLNVTYIKNPAFTGELFSDIGLYLYNSTTVKAVINNYCGVLISQAGTSVRLRNITISANKLQAISDYTFILYLDATDLIAGDSLFMQFPAQFSLFRDNLDTVFCSATWSDQSPTSLDRSEQTWNLASNTCTITNLNQAVWPISEAKSFLSTNRVIFTIMQVKNPEWSYSRIVPKYLGDPAVFGSFDKWSQKFEVFCFSGQYFQYKSRSYFLGHAGFVGYFSGGNSASVNGFDPQSLSGVIDLNPGSQTVDLTISISTSHLFAKQLTFIPSNHLSNQASLVFTSVVDNFVMTRDSTSISFRVSTSIDSPNSLNYIQWVLQEVSLDGLVSPAYISPATTLVEVYDNNLISFALGTINDMSLNTTSLPIKITTVNSPDIQLTVSLSLLDPNMKGIEFNPSVLLFTRDVNDLYFTIYANSTVFSGALGKSIYIFFTSTGTDSARFSTLPIQPFVVQSAPASSAAVITLLTFASLAQTTLSIRVTVNSACLVYYLLGSSDLSFPSLSSLQNMTQPIKSSAAAGIAGQVSAYFQDLDNTPKNTENWRTYQKRLYKNFMRTLWFDVVYVDPGVVTDVFASTWQWAGTAYTAVVYTDNGSGRYSNASFTQSTMDINPALMVYVQFQATVDPAYQPVVWNALAMSLGVLTDVLTNGQFGNNTFSWIFNADRSSPLSPLTLVASFQTGIMNANLDYAGITESFVFGYSILQESDYPVPAWNNTPQFVVAGKDYVVLNVSIVGNGQVCCIAGGFGPLNTYQIYEGMGSNNTDVSGSCVDASNYTMYYMTIGGLEPDSMYNVSCVACSAYPVWPTCMSSAESFVFNTTASVSIANDVSYAIVQACALFILIVS